MSNSFSSSNNPLTDLAATPPAPRSPNWSDQLAQRFDCTLSPILADWFDREIWNQSGHGEFHAGITPTELLAKAPEPIWPGLMNADLVPIVSNQAGDWLCARIGPDNVMATIVHWYHGGGDWIEWGDDLAQAIVFDAIQHRLPGPRRRHAIPAEEFSNSDSSANIGNADVDPLLAWALEHSPPAIGDLFGSDSIDANAVAATLIDHGVAEVAVRCELVQAALNLSALNLSALPDLASEALSHAGLCPGPDAFAKASFDRSMIDDDVAAKLDAAMGSDAWRHQEWSVAESHAVAVTKRSPEMAWAWDVAGYAAMRRDDDLVAMARYLNGSRCQVFSDQSIRLQTLWTASRAAKFSAAQLQQHFAGAVAESEYLTALCITDSIVRSDRVSQHWLAVGEDAMASGDANLALKCFIAAGWDIGMRPITAYADLLGRIASTAQKAGQTGRARLASVHRACLLDRYGT